jgi:hypothetical protein
MDIKGKFATDIDEFSGWIHFSLDLLVVFC